MTKKIIFFDTWIVGREHFQYINNHFSEQGYQTFLLHLESKIADSLPKNIDRTILSNKQECEIDGLLCRDISFYQKSFIDIIKQEDPSMVIMLNISHLQFRIMTRICQILDIPVIYLMHGVRVNKKGTTQLIESQKSNKLAFSEKLKKLKKFNYLFLQYYLATGSINETFKIFKEFVVSPYDFVWLPEKHKSLEVTKALVYSEYDIQFLNENFKVPLNVIKVVGNPKLDAALNYQSTFDRQTMLNRLGIKSKGYMLYIDQAFVESGWLTTLERSDLLMLLSGIAKENNLSLIVKMHPRGNLKTYSDNIASNILVIQNEFSLYELLSHCSLTLGHYSTALLESLAMRKSVITLNWHTNIMGVKLFEDDDIGVVRDINSLAPTINRMISVGWNQENIRSHYFPNDNNNSHGSIINEIEILLK